MANTLTIFRILLIIPICALMLYTHWQASFLVFALFVSAGITDFFDGYIARKFNQTSLFGKIMDPIADKLLSACVLILLITSSTISGPHIIAVLLIIGREIWISGLREALSQQLELPVSYLAKIKTTVQFIAIGILILPLFLNLTIWGLVALWVAAALTIITGIQYTLVAMNALKTTTERS